MPALYPRIPHLPGSRTGPADRRADASLARRCTLAALPGDEIFVQEKLDGSCVVILREGDRLHALGREGTRADASRNEGRQRFAAWVLESTPQLLPLLQDGERLVGEWLALVHSTHYRLSHSPFVPFDLFCHDGTPLPFDSLHARLAGSDLRTPALLHRGGALGPDDAMRLLGEHGHHGAVEPAEGAVWRVESRGRLIARAKFVRAGKVDGLHLPDHSGLPARWNIPPMPIDPRRELMHGWLRRLARSPARDRFVLRGSLLTAQWWPERRVDDLDFLDLVAWDEPALRDLTDQLARAPDPHTAFTDCEHSLIWADSPLPGLRLALAGTTPAGPATLQIDISPGDPLAAPAEPIEIGGTRVLAVRPEIMLAWKTHGLFELGPRGKWRPKDLLDLVELSARAPIDQALLVRAVDLAFTSRNTPPGHLRDMVHDLTWGASRGSARKWRRFLRDNPQFNHDLTALLARARALLAPLCA